MLEICLKFKNSNVWVNNIKENMCGLFWVKVFVCNFQVGNKDKGRYIVYFLRVYDLVGVRRYIFGKLFYRWNVIYVKRED